MSTRSATKIKLKRKTKAKAGPSSTPSSIRKPTIDSSPIPNQSSSQNNSPLASKIRLTASGRTLRVIKTSPLRSNSSLPSPSPEAKRQLPNDSVNLFNNSNSLSKSSPLKNKKTVMFSDNLIDDFIPDDPKNPFKDRLETPIKSILKMNSSPHLTMETSNQEFTFSLSPKKSNKVSPATYEFWSPGNIPRIINSKSLQDELVSFRALILGGITVLNLDNCDRQFEIYATLNLLMKDMDDRKLDNLIQFLPDLLNLMKSFLVNMDDDIIKAKNPFSIRTAVQIIKMFSSLLSNPKLLNRFWKKNTNYETGLWCLSYSSSMILNSTISKSLLSANLQVLKEHKLHSKVPMKQQEAILNSILKMKQLHSTSVLTERLLTLKSLVANFTAMMEKNIKSWIFVLFNYICDFTSPFYQKSLSSASFLLLETSKQYLTSKTINFEFSFLLGSPISRALSIDLSQQSINSTPLDTSQTVFHYLTERLLESSVLENSISTTLIMDIWLGITLSYFNNPNNLKYLTPRWMNIIEKAVQKPDIESKLIGIKSWRAFIYIYCNDNNYSNEGLEVIFKIFKLLKPDQDSLPSTVYSKSLIILISQILYAFFNNKKFESRLDEIWSKWLYPVICDWGFKNEVMETFALQAFSHMIITRLNKEATNEFYLIKTISNEGIHTKELEGFDFQFILNNHSDLYDIFVNKFWLNNKTNERQKFNVLSALLSKLKYAFSSKKIMSSDESFLKANHVITCYENFVEIYTKNLKKLADATSKLEYLNKLVTSVKTNLGTKIFFTYSKDGQSTYKLDNFYTKLIGESIKYGVKTTEVLKFSLSQNKGFEYKILESTIIFFKNETSLTTFINNYLESKIFTNITSFELIAIINIVNNLPKKSTLVINNLLLLFLKFNDMKVLMKQLEPLTWDMESFFCLLQVIVNLQESNTYNFKPLMFEIVVAKLKEKDEQFTKNFLLTLIIHEKSQFWLLQDLKEFIFYHVVDPSNSYSEETHTELKDFFKTYIDIIKANSIELFDSTVSHGLTVASALKESGNTDARVTEVERILYLSLKEVDWNKMIKVKQFLDLKRKKDATNTSPVTNGSYNTSVTSLDSPTSVKIKAILAQARSVDAVIRSPSRHNPFYSDSPEKKSIDLKKEVVNISVSKRDKPNTDEESEEIDTTKSKASEIEEEEDSIEDDNEIQAQGSVEEVNETSGEESHQQVPDSIADKDTLVIVNKEKKPDSFEVIDSSLESNQVVNSSADLSLPKVSKKIDAMKLKDSLKLSSLRLIPVGSNLDDDNIDENLSSSDSNNGSDVFYDSFSHQNDTQIIDSTNVTSKTLIETPPDVESTQEVPDSRSPFHSDNGKVPVDIPASVELIHNSNIDETPIDGSDNLSDILTMDFDSSPIKPRSHIPLTRSGRKIISLPEVTIPLSDDEEEKEKKKEEERKNDDVEIEKVNDPKPEPESPNKSSDIDSDEIRLIDDVEFSQSLKARQNNRKRTLSPEIYDSPSKRVHSDDVPSSYCSPLPKSKNTKGVGKQTELITEDAEEAEEAEDVVILSPMKQLSEVVDTISDDDIKNMSDEEVYDMETKLMRFMLKLRESRVKR